MPGSSRRLPTAPLLAERADGLSPAFLALFAGEALAGLTVLDVGTGRGRLAAALAPRCRRVVGIDLDPLAIEQARRAAAAVTNVEFVLADAEATEYAVWAPDAVVAHLCMSDAIIERAGRALAPGRVFAFAAIHVDQWRETGRRSRFAFDPAHARDALKAAGFAVEHVSVECHVREFASVEEGLAAAVALEEKWKADGRWFHYIKFLEEGGRTLTRSHLHVKARRR